MGYERGAFWRLHEEPGAFIIPNPWDTGTARMLAALGFPALATTSAGMAFALGKPVVIYKDDARSAFHGLDNAMLSGLTMVDFACAIADIPDRVREALTAHSEANAGWKYESSRLAPHVISEAQKGESAGKLIRKIAPAT